MEVTITLRITEAVMVTGITITKATTGITGTTGTIDHSIPPVKASGICILLKVYSKKSQVGAANLH
jgi:hypothetical protein